MTNSFFTLLCGTLLLAACTSTAPEHASPTTKHDTNELMIGKPFPTGTHYPLSDIQTSEFQAVLAHATPVDVSHEGSPVAQLSYVQVNNHTYYFLPPGQLVDYSLSPKDRKQFERLVREATHQYSKA